MEQGRSRFNLKAVVKQTGLKPDTLRAWERRYGLPTPERSSGGHRLYSQRDIDTIKWLMARQQEGLSISRAVESWEQLTAEGSDPLKAATPIATGAAPIPVPHLVGETIAQLREQWIDACLAYDEQRAEQLLNQAFALYSPETVAVEHLQRAVAEIGEGWYKSDVTVQQEHFCSSLAVRRLEALVMAAPAPIRPGRILAACPPEEQHVIGLLLLTFLLRRRGWEVVYLGANVPIEQLETTVAVVQPQLVIMAAQLLHTAATLREAAQELQRAQVPLAYGGLIFNLLPALRERIPGHFLGEQLPAVPQRVESLVAGPRPTPTTEAVPEEYLRALEHFQERQGLVEARVIQAQNGAGYAHNHLALANRELSLNIGAALALGDMDYLGTDIEWVTGLLRNHQLSVEALYGYLDVYRQTIGMQLDERGQPIVNWLGKLLNGFRPT
jgi:DNA-binding transcriptional MerR regulator/methylmalonyl-CoA mutase cobalamin-binding subunit